MKVLILGGSGMLGHKLAHVLGAEPDFDVHATARGLLPAGFQAPDVEYHYDVDLAAGAARLETLLGRVTPDVVVNAVGAIKQKDLHGALEGTFFLNGTLPHLLPLLQSDKSTRVVHFSTDCVFTGDRGGYSEADPPDAEDVYGRSKACGEIGYGAHVTVRTSIIGFEIAGHLGLLSWLFRQPPGSTLRGYSRAVFSGLPTCTLARTVADIIRRGTRGLHHVASAPITKLELLERINEAFGLGHTIVPADDVVIDRSLDDSRFRRATGTARPGWSALVQELLADYESLPYASIYQALRGREGH